jgi:hypothetical protein
MEFTLHGNASLKGKRSVSNSLKRKLRNKFNLAVAEVEALDSHTRLVLAAVCVSNSHRHAESLLNKVLLHSEAACDEEMTDSRIDLLAAE